MSLADYQRIKLDFDPDNLRDRFLRLRREVQRTLGRKDGLGGILCDTIDQYLLVIELLRARGTVDFGRHSRELYGAARDHLRGDRKSLRQLGEKLCENFSLPAAEHLARPYLKHISASSAVDILQQRLGDYCQPGDIRVILSDGIVSDAAAGGDHIKINQDAEFTEFDLQVLAVHEGWAHVGTCGHHAQRPQTTLGELAQCRFAAGNSVPGRVGGLHQRLVLSARFRGESQFYP